jgi:hypothetical protein
MISIWRVWSVVHRKEVDVISIQGTRKYKRRPDILGKGPSQYIKTRKQISLTNLRVQKENQVRTLKERVSKRHSLSVKQIGGTSQSTERKKM